MFGLTRGEIALAAFVFALIYGAGLLPRIAKALAGGGKKPSRSEDKPSE